jgi:hypothetical protein
MLFLKPKIYIGYSETRMKEIYAVLQELEVEFERGYDAKGGFYFKIGKQFRKVQLW